MAAAAVGSGGGLGGRSIIVHTKEEEEGHEITVSRSQSAECLSLSQTQRGERKSDSVREENDALEGVLFPAPHALLLGELREIQPDSYCILHNIYIRTNPSTCP